MQVNSEMVLKNKDDAVAIDYFCCFADVWKDNTLEFQTGNRMRL